MRGIRPFDLCLFNMDPYRGSFSRKGSNHGVPSGNPQSFGGECPLRLGGYNKSDLLTEVHPHTTHDQNRRHEIHSTNSPVRDTEIVQ